MVEETNEGLYTLKKNNEIASTAGSDLKGCAVLSPGSRQGIT